MSYYHENVIWQSENGTWSRGFFERISMDNGSEDYDSEWDDDFDFERFGWVSTGHMTEEAAARSWKGANPGSHTTIEFGKDTAEECRNYDEMAWMLRNPKAGRPTPHLSLRERTSTW